MDKAFITKKLIKLDLVMKLYSRKKLNELGLYFGQIGIIEHIRRNPNCAQIDIAQAMSVSPASIALSTKRLEKAGFITKEIDENNLRCKRLKLTEKGADVARKASDIKHDQDVKMFQGFSDDELEILDRFIDRITMNLTEESENIISRSIVQNLVKEIEKLD